MTHQDWITAIATAIAAAVGGLAGGWLALIAAKQTNQEAKALAQQDREAQAELAAAQQRAALAAAADERELNRREQRDSIARNAAVELLGRIGAVDRVLPNLQLLKRPRPGGSEDERRIASREALEWLKGGQREELLLVNNPVVVSRYRHLARLASELTMDLGSEIVVNRAIQDVSNYVKYVLITLQAFVDGDELPEETAPPILRRNENDGSTWMPSLIPEDWDRI
ncbi:hypothetical protein [Actinacidiphila acidipaludis]|uniref:Uncharacterized protein n=1 Tax=Actinacidiphila acidipaludis TaxID=2873382 RepID=A0ABS7Q9C1_9ACTN|nr:hypothetical protein [Streptomyces acidipaludis]MBY8879746.1 hypothetical protein [Streptomyces acidipaludis]